MKKIASVVFAFVLVAVLSVSAFAAGSVEADIVKDYDGGSATYSKDAESGQFTFTANTKDGYNFVGWDIAGDYKIISGSLDSETITVVFLDGTTSLDQVSAEPLFEAIDEPEPDEPGDEPEPDEPVAPKTGDSMALAVLAVAALGGMVASKKRASK